MTTISLPLPLAERLYRVAQRLGHSPEQCALLAIRQYVECCEDSAATSRAINGNEQVVRLPEGFYD